MIDPSVTERVTKRAAELEPGDWIRFYDDGGDYDFGGLVDFVKPYTDAVLTPRVLVVRLRPGSSSPETARYRADEECELLTEAEVVSALEYQRRTTLANQLQRFAGILVDDELPVGPEYAVARLNIQLPSIDDLGSLAEKLGLQVESSGSYGTVVWPAAQLGVVDCPLQVTWHAYTSAIAADPLGTTINEARFSDNPWTRAAAQAYEDDGFGFSREQESFVGTAPVPAHVQGEAMGGRGPNAAQVTRYFSFGHGQTDPDTGESLLDKYVTVIGPDGEACREAMFASRYGREWAFEYAPGTPQADEWISRWTEHERIVVDPDADPLFADIVAMAAARANEILPDATEHAIRRGLGE